MAKNQELWEDCPHSSAPLLRAPCQLVQQEIWGLCLLFLALAEVVSVAEDTGAAARGPAGAGTGDSRFQDLISSQRWGTF